MSAQLYTWQVAISCPMCGASSPVVLEGELAQSGGPVELRRYKCLACGCVTELRMAAAKMTKEPA